MIGVPAASWVGQRRSPPTSAFWLVGYLLGGDRTYTPKCKRPNPSTEKYPKSVAEPHRHFLDCYQPKVQGEMKEPHEDAPFSYFSLRRRVRVGRSPDLQRALPQKPFWCRVEGWFPSSSDTNVCHNGPELLVQCRV